MAAPIQLLVVEDSDDDFVLLLRALRQDSLAVNAQRVETAAQLSTALAGQSYDAVVSDFDLLGFTGLDALRMVRAANLDTPFVLVSGVVGEEVAAEVMKAGANDFVLKRNLKRLGAVLVREISEAANRHQIYVAEQAARLSQQCLAAVSDGVLITGPDRLTVSVNAAFERLTGYATDDIKGRSCSILQGPNTDPQTVLAMRQALQDAHAFTGEILNYRKDGGAFWNELSISPVHDTEGQLVHFVGIQRDVTERKAVQNKLRLSDRFFSQAREAIVVTDQMGIIQSINQAFTTITGYASEEALGSLITSLTTVRGEEPFLQKGWNAIVQHGTWQGEIRCHRKDGAACTQWLTGTTLYETDGSVCNYVGTFVDITEQLASKEKIAWLSHFDVLTGLPNRALLADRCDHDITVAKRTGGQLAILAIDLHDFSAINERYGHLAGDALLQEFARRLVQAVRESDTVSRVGGGNFAVLLPAVNPNDASSLAKKLLHNVATNYELGDTTIKVSASVGIAIYPEDGSSSGSLFQSAEFAVHANAKKEDVRVNFFNAALYQAIQADSHLVDALRSAIKDDQLTLHYQPFADLQTGEIAGMEALLRWTHPVMGSVRPGQFIPLAEKYGLIIEIGAWVIERACTDLRQLIDNGTRVVPVSINISPIQFHKLDIVQVLADTLARQQLNPKLICLEVTEGTLVEDVEHSSALLHRIKNLGLSLSLDDFGTGYSSLSYLKIYPFDKVKIDQSFVRNIGLSASDEVIIKIVIAMGHGLGMRVIAEGVETEAQSAFVRDHGCNETQGYYFARPAPLQVVQDMLRCDLRLPEHLRHPPSDPSTSAPI